MPVHSTAEVGAGPNIIVERASIRSGTRDMVSEAAMHASELEAALSSGAAAAARAAEEGVKVVGIGEIGIGNTTAAAALLSALTGVAPSFTVCTASHLAFLYDLTRCWSGSWRTAAVRKRVLSTSSIA